MPVTLSWTLNDALAARVVAAFCAAYGYQATVYDDEGVGSPNPESQNQFTKRMIANFIKGTVEAYEKKLRVDAAASQAGDPIEV